MENDKKALNGWNNIDILLELFVLLVFYIHATRFNGHILFLDLALSLIIHLTVQIWN